MGKRYVNAFGWVLFALLISVKIVSAQSEDDRIRIISMTDTAKLNALAAERWDQIDSYQQQNGKVIPSRIINSSGQLGYLGGFNKAGVPQYDFDDNYDAAVSNRIKRIWVGGESGINLDGAGIIIGHWEAGGYALTSHNELVGRITRHDSGSEVTSHATHTAGTMIGRGDKGLARGMAASASIFSYNSVNDESEMAVFAANGGILSNHSYYSGSPDGVIELYGAYSEHAAEWDEIMYYGPYLLSCKSAGNTRNDGVHIGDGGYDIVFTMATAKNILVVGAIEDIIIYSGPGDVVQADFSSWGPTDDWRIKPDIVVNGVSLYSADNASNASYDTKSGTSMASAVAAGTVALLQQYYHRLTGEYMRSATVKALLTSTADEAGENEGPDFQNGWGLLNAERAAEVITNNGGASLISEHVLADGEEYMLEIEVDGNSPLTLAIAWTDPPGTPSLGNDNLTPRLVNDLDVRVVGEGMHYEPWVMTPNATSNNFTTPAGRGDNFRDNIERIDAGIPPAGTYTVSVSHKGKLQYGAQHFSLVAFGLKEQPLSAKTPFLKEESILLYPVPFSDELTIEVPAEISARGYQVEIMDLRFRYCVKERHNTESTTIDVSGLSAGIYGVKITTEKGIYFERIVKE